MMPSGPSRAEVEFKPVSAFRRPVLIRCITLAVVTLILVVAPTPLTHGLAWITGPLAAAFGVTYLWRGRFRTKVTGRGIEVRGYFNHFVPWQDVRDIEIGGFGSADMRLDESYDGPRVWRGTLRGGSGTSRDVSPNRMAHLATVKVVRANGRKLLLRAPLVTGWASDPEFTDKARQLQELSEQYGIGSAWRLPRG